MKQNKNAFTVEEALGEFDELKQIALNCLDQNGNPNISAALRAVENMAKITLFVGSEIVKIPYDIIISALEASEKMRCLYAL